MALNKTMKMATTGAVALGLATVASNAMAQSETVSGTVSATVLNSFNLVQTTPMNFGTIAAFSDAALTATITISTAGVLSITNNAPAQFIIVDSTAATQGIFDVTNAAPSTNVTITLNNAVDLVCAACSGSQPAITLGPAFVHNAGATPTTSAAGALNIDVGTTLTTVVSANQYEDGTYSGSFDVTVSY